MCEYTITNNYNLDIVISS